MSIQPAVYILASSFNGTLYIGVTSDLVKRTWQHRNEVVRGFTQRYAVHHLVYFELHPTMLSAIERETRIKRWRRDWKIALIQRRNPDWVDLWPALFPGNGDGFPHTRE